MRRFKNRTTRPIGVYFFILAVMFGAVMAAPALLRARTDGNTITVTNNARRIITHIYLAAPDRDYWGPDQLDDALLRSGQSLTISNADCYPLGVKVIAEDQDGCFVSTVMACAAEGSWTITDSAGRDCGN